MVVRVGEVTDPILQALFEVSAALTLVKRLADFENH